MEGKRIALLGLAFKPNTDDTRFAPAVTLARRLIDAGAAVVGYDPRALANARKELPELLEAPDPYEAARGAHCPVVCSEWPEFRDVDLQELRGLMEYPIVVDGRNIFDPIAMQAAGFFYYPTGQLALLPVGPVGNVSEAHDGFLPSCSFERGGPRRFETAMIFPQAER